MLEHRGLGLVQLVDGQVEIDVAALRVDDIGVPTVAEFLVIDVLMAAIKLLPSRTSAQTRK